MMNHKRPSVGFPWVRASGASRPKRHRSRRHQHVLRAADLEVVRRARLQFPSFLNHRLSWARRAIDPLSPQDGSPAAGGATLDHRQHEPPRSLNRPRRPCPK